MSRHRDSDTRSQTGDRDRTSAHSVLGWATDSELVRTFDRPVTVADAVGSTVGEAIDEWPELKATPPLYQFVDADRLDGLFEPRATNDSEWLPSATFPFQSCRVTVLYGPKLRVIVERDP